MLLYFVTALVCEPFLTDWYCHARVENQHEIWQAEGQRAINTLLQESGIKANEDGPNVVK